MSFLNKFNTVYFKLIASYTMIIFLVTMVIGLTSYFYFSANFNREVTKINRQLLHYQKKMTDENVFRQAESVYVNLVTAQNDNADLNVLYEQSYIGHHAKIRSVRNFLTATVASHSELLQSIDIYFRHNGLLISSQSGMTDVGAPAGGQSPYSAEWTRRMEQSERSLLWMADTREGAEAIVTLVGSYPFNAPGKANQGIIAIRLRSDALEKAVAVASGNRVGRTYVISSDGQVIAGDAEASGMPDAAPLSRIREAGAAEDHFTFDLDGAKSIVSYVRLSPDQWKLATVTPVAQYYKTSSAIQSMLLLVSAIAIVVGFILSYWFAFRIYNPLKTIMARTRRLFAEHADARLPMSDEYKVIDNVIDKLSGKILHLESTLEENKPLIKHHLANGLLFRTLTDRSDLKERLRTLNLSMQGFRLQAAIVHLDGHGQWSSIGDETRQFIRYSLIDRLEQRSDEQRLCIAILLSDTEIGVIHGLARSWPQPLHLPLRAMVAELNEYVSGPFGIRVAASAGAFVDSPFRLHASYEQALAAAKHRYFHPEREVLDEAHWRDREQSKEQLSYEWLEKFSAALTGKKPADVEHIVDEVVELMRSGPYPSDHCHHYWRELVARYYRYVKAMNHQTGDIIPAPMLEQFARLGDIRQFRDWLLRIVSLTIDYMEEKGKHRHGEIVELAKAYIADHLETDLSLQALAERVYLSPRYLSKIFKQETGMNFVDYVNQERMRHAETMILTTDLNIDQIARKAGFNSTAYFIKKFRETYGKTPKMYKQDRLAFPSQE